MKLKKAYITTALKCVPPGDKPTSKELKTCFNYFNKEIADISVIEARNQVRQTIETSYNDALAASKSFTASQKQVKALEESFRIIKSQYNLGSVNYTEYQISNNNLVRATNDLLISKYDYIFKLKVLDFYQGKKLTFFCISKYKISTEDPSDVNLDKFDFLI